MIDQSAQAILALAPTMELTLPFLGNTDITRYVVALVVFLLLTLVFWIIRAIVVNRLVALSKRTKVAIDDVVVGAIRGIRTWVYTIVSLYITLKLFDLSDTVDLVLTAIVLFAVVWQLIEIAACFVDYGVKNAIEKDEDGDGIVDPNAANASSLVTLMSRIILWALGGLFVLSNLGIEITSLIAGLGIGGIAIAFALQGILSDLFASFSIYFDKPFRIGDFVIVGTDSGTVEKIGIKSTRIRTLQGEELVISNNELTATRVQNFKKMQERRIVFEFGVTYETPHEKVREIPGMVERTFGTHEGARLDRVHFKTFGDSALIFEVVFYVQSPDYTEYLNIQQSINFELMSVFSEAGIEFAYPTQTLYLKKEV